MPLVPVGLVLVVGKGPRVVEVPSGLVASVRLGARLRSSSSSSDMLPSVLVGLVLVVLDGL